ncbi:MAG: lipoyl(octanoyl) transferase LipB [Gammaproteobacteria bacterium]|nr:lipoyl(octanoyl) transferase LipB [Gammaproteobacteria bacterium]
MPLKLPIIKNLGQTDYETVWQAMKQFTLQRDADTDDELWVTQHCPVYTQGLNGRQEHLLSTSDIPVVQVDRGGQVTYHGPGQLVIYCLLDLNRLGIGIRQLVMFIEEAIIDLLKTYDIDAYAKREAPGVYVGQAKIAALGLRIRKGYCYHGLSLNLDMDLTPFSGINPCGFKGLEVTQLSYHVENFSLEQVSRQLCSQLISTIGYEL